jgi:integrase
MRGSVTKKGSRWYVILDLGRDETGKRKRKWHGGYATKREAERVQAKLVHDLDTGMYSEPSRAKVAQYLTDWLAAKPNLAQTTREGYHRELKRIIKHLGERRLKDLTPGAIKGFYRELTAAGYAPKSVRNTAGVLHKALADAVGDGALPRNPADRLELPQSGRPETQTWSADELARFLSHVESDRLYAAWVVLCSTGMRRSELLGLRWRNVDLEAGTAAITDTVVMANNRPKLRLGETKSRRSRRVIALDTATITVLREHKACQNIERLRAGEAWEDLHLVFSTELGGVISPNLFTRWTKKLAVEAGVRPLTPHPAGRHTWATLALSSGKIHPKVVQERLGHSSISVTLDRYSHVTQGMDREAAEIVAAMIKGSG